MASTSNNELAFIYSQQGVPIFVGQDYEQWSVLMQTLFISHDLWDIVEEGFTSPTPEQLAGSSNAQRKEHKENKTKDARALSFIHQGVSRSILPRITGAKTSKDAWQILKNQFGGHEKVVSIKLQNLWRDFDGLVMKENENVQDFFSRVSIIINQIRGYGDTLEERKIVEKVLRCLPARFEHDIFLRLPAESLLRLSVCYQHHTNYQQNNQHTLLLQNGLEGIYSFPLDSLHFINGPQLIDAIHTKLLPCQITTPIKSYCNGLILMDNNFGRIVREEELVIWNPLTGELRFFEQPNLIYITPRGYAFGYDYDADDYKVVIID